MKLKSQIEIPLAPEEVWQTLELPELMEMWNPKCTRCLGVGRAIRQGDRFEAEFQMSGKPSTTTVEVLEFDPPRQLTMRHHLADVANGKVDETYVLEAIGGNATRVHQTVDLAESGIPRWALWVMKLLDRFGKPVGDGPLEGLREVSVAQAKMRD